MPLSYMHAPHPTITHRETTMRKNTAAVVRAFLAGKALRPCRSIWTDGTDIFSYYTALVVRSTNVDGPVWLLNNTKYSPTTSRHQHGLRMALADGPLAFVDNINMGSLSRRELLAA